MTSTGDEHRGRSGVRVILALLCVLAFAPAARAGRVGASAHPTGVSGFPTRRDVRLVAASSTPDVERGGGAACSGRSRTPVAKRAKTIFNPDDGLSARGDASLARPIMGRTPAVGRTADGGSSSGDVFHPPRTSRRFKA